MVAPFNFKLTLDFHGDWIKFIKFELGQLPILQEKDYINIPQNKLDYYYFNWLKRAIRPKPRNVHISKELDCHTRLQEGLDLIIEKIEKGEELIPHLSRKIKDINYSDQLLNDWGIHHLHLGTLIEEDGFVQRNSRVSHLYKFLLYARFNEENAYLIVVMDHKSFSNQRLVQIIHYNWPETIKQFKVDEAFTLDDPISNEFVKELRKIGGTYFIEAEKGAVYTPIGGGYSIGGTSLSALTAGDYYHHKVTNLEKQVKENMFFYLGAIREKIGRNPKQVHFKLYIEKDNFYIYEIYSEILFK
ncbi:hypothetical protein B4V02_06480 [Paenibacillus kribbensis]|uniref:Uncharacterized protein n=1 Tax=Paenibacillus kribbensis TaxID=172713 RepID=A0A222WIV0_9BACL|nr:hypothetical protein [Paenibacillus kribbensis]ASR46347.1 hypothetical protein B4V02_06480 [Paenibacillus kribbensis]